MRISLTLLLALLLPACGLIYKQDIQQGSALEREDVETLETGMTKRQVLVLLGSPSVHSPFHDDRWDYISTFTRRGGEPQAMRRLSLDFENDRLVAISGDYLDEIAEADQDLREIEERTQENALDERFTPPRQ